MTASGLPKNGEHSDVLHNTPDLLCRNGEQMATTLDTLAHPKFQT